SSASSASTASSASDDPKGREVLGQFASPYLSNHFTARLAFGCGSHGHVTRSPATLNVQRVRWAKLAPSCLVWLATWPSTETGETGVVSRSLTLRSAGRRRGGSSRALPWSLRRAHLRRPWSSDCG